MAACIGFQYVTKHVLSILAQSNMETGCLKIVWAWPDHCKGGWSGNIEIPIRSTGMQLNMKYLCDITEYNTPAFYNGKWSYYVVTIFIVTGAMAPVEQIRYPNVPRPSALAMVWPHPD